MENIKTKLPIILGSGSRTRKFLLQHAGYEFRIMSADIDEKSIRSDDPATMVLNIAKAKAAALLPNISQPSFLITCDTVVVVNGQVLEKPESLEQARQFLKLYTKYPASTLTALVVTNTQTQEQFSQVDECIIYFKKFSQADIEEYLQNPHIFSWAGGLGIENLEAMQDYEFLTNPEAPAQLSKWIDHFAGDLDSAMGLPLGVLRGFLR